jgi:hypothetical protein
MARPVLCRGRAAADAHRRVAVVAHGLHRAGDPARAGEGRQRHRLPLVVGHVQAQQVVGLHARRRVGLHHHALQPPGAGEVVDVGRAQRGGDAALMRRSPRPARLALSRSMSSCSCGASSRPSGRTCVSTGLWPPAPSSWLRAASRASWPRPARSCRRKLKPEAGPVRESAAGSAGKMKASRMPIRRAEGAPGQGLRRTAGPVRSAQSFSVTKASAAFWPWPEKLKPSTPTMLCTSGCLSMKPSTCCITSSARSCVAPGGSCTLTSRLPWSSLGRNEVGRRRYTTTAPPRWRHR